MIKLNALLIGAMLIAPVALPPAVQAQSQYDDRRDRRSYNDCKKSSGTTGTVVGGVGGAVAGNALGGGTVGTVAGGVGGALLGRHLDKKHDAAQNRRNGC